MSKVLNRKSLAAAALLAMALAPNAMADGRKPGSALIYPIHRSGGAFFTVVSVTNTNLDPVNGETNVHYQYLNVLANPQSNFLPLDCIIIDRTEHLTPADTLSVLTTCHNATGGQEGYLVVSAQDPDLFKSNWSFNHLIGSELVVNAVGGIYSLNAIPFESPQPAGTDTDMDGDGQLDFNGTEYEGVPDLLYIDSFIAAAGSSLTLINLTGGKDFMAAVKFHVWNDNEFPLSATLMFRCWFEEPLTAIALVFQDAYLRNNTPDDPAELDINCDNMNDLETGWARIDGIVASSAAESIPNPALLGALTDGPVGLINGGRLLWESPAKQFNGDFFKFGVDDPEF